MKLPAHSVLTYRNTHLHSIGRRVRARLDAAFTFQPLGHEPKYRQTTGAQAGGFELELDIPAGESNVLRDGFFRVQRPTMLRTFEPHLHSSGKRMCIEALYPNNAREMLNCADYNHNWVRVYVYEQDARRCSRLAPSCTCWPGTTTRPATRASSIRGTGRAGATGRSTTCSTTCRA